MELYVFMCLVVCIKELIFEFNIKLMKLCLYIFYFGWGNGWVGRGGVFYFC